MLLLMGMLGPERVLAQTSVPQDWLQSNKQMEAGNPQAALPHLERLVRDYPDVVLYRLELGYALYLLERDARAQFHFQQARGATLNAEQRKAVDYTLAQIAARKTWSIRLDMRVEPASNAGKGTAAGSINVGGLVLTIPNTLRARSATGVVVNAGATYRPRLSQTLEASLSFDTSVRHYDDKALRETQIVGRAGLRYSPRQNLFFEGGVLGGKAYTGGAPYSDRFGVYGSYSSLIGDRTSIRFGVERYRLTHDTFSIADGPRTQLDAQLSYALSPNMILRSRGYLLHADASSTLQSGLQGALTIGAIYAFKGGLVAAVDVTTGFENRDGINALTGNRRKDRSVSINTEFYSSQYQIGPFVPVLRANWQRNTSNQVINSFSNSSVSLGFRTSF
jgi:hypothetical protein